MRTILRIFFWIFAILVIAIAASAWWFIYRPLPQIDGSASLPGLQHEVTVERDLWGVPHIRAASVEDLAEAQGYVMAQDRLWQMDLLRRAAGGQLSEILGPRTLPIDREFRTNGFARAAERDATLLDPESRQVFEAYARGVNKFIEQHQNNLPLEFSLLRYKPRDWRPSDSLLISAYFYRTLSNTWESELDRSIVTARVSPDRAKELFSEEAPMDRFVVGDPNVANDGSQRSAVDDDEDDDDDMEPDTVLKASLHGTDRVPAPDTAPDLSSALMPAVEGILAESRREIRGGLGSNNWVVSGSHTATGKPLLANDTHLELNIPCIWYELHLTAPGWNVKGFTFPGAPMVIIGHNDRIAWGLTNNGADVQDLYIETFNPASPDEYRVKSVWTKAQIFDETIHVKGQSDEHFKVTVTRHGPIVHHAGDKAYALRAVFADVDGNIGYIMAARVPLRKKGHGEVPVPGDTDDYEWNGYIPFDQLPQAFNPESGLIATANARVVGPNYKPYLTDRWEDPYRTARIYDLLHDRHDLRPEDMLTVQTDTYSYPHAFLADQLSAAARIAKPKDSRTQKLIDGLKDWNGIAGANSPETSFLEAFRVTSLESILQPFLGSDTDLYRWRSTTFLQRVLTDRPAKWLPPAYKNYDDLLVASADKAVTALAKQAKSGRIEDWPWKRFDSLEMDHYIGREGLLRQLLSITNKPQSGTRYSVRAATKTHGPAMRFVGNPGNWDESILLIPAGESGQPGSSHYSDQFSYWYEGKPIFAPFSDAAEAKTRKHTLTLKPGS